MQTSSAGAGFVNLWSASWDALEVELERYALDFYRALSSRHDIGLKPVGMVTLAVTAQGGQELAAAHARALARLMPDEIAFLSPQEVQLRFPIVDEAQVHARLWWPCGRLVVKCWARVG